MALTSKQKFELNKFIKELKTYRGRHTELVSVYIPAGYDITKITNHLFQEQGTAVNIKSTSTRKNVQDALEKMIQHLKLYPKTPENGLAAFSGNVAEREGQSDVKVWSIEPPIPMNQRLYRCDKQFILDPIADMTETKEVYGLVVMDKREGNIALLKGKTIVELANTSSNVPGKTRAGGQSSARYMRIRIDAAKDFYKNIAELMQSNYLDLKNNLKGIIIGGPGHTKYDFVDKYDYINTELKNKIIGIKDLSYTGPFGLQELLEKSEDLLANESVMTEKNLMNKFFDLLNSDNEMVTYGKEHVRSAIEKSAVDTLLISETLDDDTLDEFEQLCENFGTNFEMISIETREGKQLNDIGKFAAILRYKLNY